MKALRQSPPERHVTCLNRQKWGGGFAPPPATVRTIDGMRRDQKRVRKASLTLLNVLMVSFTVLRVSRVLSMTFGLYSC